MRPCACPPSPGAARRPPRANRAATPSWRCGTPTSASRTGRRTGGSHPAHPQHLAAEPPSIAPHNNPAPPPLSDFDYLLYSRNQRTKGTLGTPITQRLTTPRTSARASRTSPSPPAVLAMQSTHAPRAPLAPPPLPAPSSPAWLDRYPRLAPHRPIRVAPREPPTTSPSPRPSPRPTNDDRSPRPTRQPLPSHQPPATSHQPRSPTPQHRAPLRSRQPLQLHVVLILPTKQRRAPPPSAWTPDDAPGGH